jgi:uncharacterized membrane protein YfcA
MRSETNYRGLQPLLAWIATFFAVWSSIAVVVLGTDSIEVHWGLALGMVFRSLAGAVVPVGGGGVNSSWLVLHEGVDRETVISFSFAIQLVGMTSGAIYLLCQRAPIDWRAVLFGCVGCAIGTPLGFVVLRSTITTDSWLALSAGAWAGFGAVLLCSRKQIPGISRRILTNVSLAGYSLCAGIIGGVLSAGWGAGAGVILYLVLVFRDRCDLRTAIGSCIIVMAFNAALGFVIGPGRLGLTGETIRLWVWSAPIGCIGVPLGLNWMSQARFRLGMAAVASVLLMHGAFVVFYLLAPLNSDAGVLAVLAALFPIVVAVALNRPVFIRSEG